MREYSKERIWYGVEELPLDNEGFTKAVVRNDSARIVEERLDMQNSRVILLVRYSVRE